LIGLNKIHIVLGLNNNAFTQVV